MHSLRSSTPLASLTWAGRRRCAHASSDPFAAAVRDKKIYDCPPQVPDARAHQRHERMWTPTEKLFHSSYVAEVSTHLCSSSAVALNQVECA